MNYKFFIAFLLLLFSQVSQAQIVEDGCLKINFESILDSVPTSGMSLGDQYFLSTGVRFYLENGSVPVIAGLGAPLEAFASAFGPDSSPDEDILGQFMLTDDGLLGSADFSPLFISFENPIDSLSAIILDLDGNEYFDITAFGLMGEVLYEQQINAGDPMTGDGRATPFGFNIPSCEGTVYSVSFAGVRTDGGGFGLAMDNFVFCFEGVDLLEDLEVLVTDIVCQDNPGQIEIINNGDLDLMYSIDGNNFNSTGIFPDLPTGDYLILVVDENGCQAILNEVVQSVGPTVIEEIIVTHTSCGLDNGSFQVFATQEEGVIYFIDAFNIFYENTFSDMAPGTYPVTVIGPTGCSASQVVTINPSEELFLDEVVAVDDGCQKTIGSITVNTTGGTGLLSYSIDNGNSFQNEPIFNSLSQGFYEIVLQDEAFCTLMDTISIYETPGLLLGDILTTGTLCELATGTIAFSPEGGTGILQFQINDGSFQDISYFSDLEAGEYSIIIADEIGCEWEAFTEIESPICPIYIPNIFTPESNDLNNLFRMYTLATQDIQIVSYLIYDRWGSRIYSAYNFDIFSDESWWKGRSDGVKWASGVYVYQIEVEFYNGSKRIYTGDISLIR